MTQTTDHDWLYGGTSPDTICLKCGYRRDAPEVSSTNSQSFAPCKGALKKCKAALEAIEKAKAGT